nr:hypothetical protein [uncultured bacterium]
MLVLVGGLPGSGKTYFSKALAHHSSACHINSDVVRKDLQLMEKYDLNTKKKVYEEMLSRTKKHLLIHPLVIVDSTFYLEKIRNLYLDLAHSLSLPIKIIEIKAAPETIKKRISHQRPDSEADFEVYLKLREQFEPYIQPHLTLWSDQLSTENMIKEAMAYIQSI